MKMVEMFKEKIMKKILILLLVASSFMGYSQQSQKQIWVEAELVSGEGATIHKWKTESFTQFITQRVCNKKFLVISSTDTKVLQMISPSSIFDISTIRSFEQIGEVVQADRDSIEIVYKIEYKSLNYPERLLLFTDSVMSFVMFMTNRDVALVLHNGQRK